MVDRASIRMPNKMVEDIDECVKIGGYTDRSEFVREACRMWIREHKQYRQEAERDV